jgi:alpha-amylase
MRGTILQPWNWNTPVEDENGHKLWPRISRTAQDISNEGYTAVWLPPVTQALEGVKDRGYGIKDWNNWNSDRYGSQEELHDACTALQGAQIQVYHDQVHNHLMGGEKEKGILCLHVKEHSKNTPAFPGAKWHYRDIYSKFPWLGLNHHHFDCYYDGQMCFALSGKTFEREAQQDPLMGCDLDFDHPEVNHKLHDSGRRYYDGLPVDGYRFDAVKHIRPKATLSFLHNMRVHAHHHLFAVGELLDPQVTNLHNYINQTHGQITLFDVPLQRNFERASQEHERYDLRTILNGTLTKDQPTLSVPFVHSHDDMPPIHNGPQRGHYVGDWFISQAYAITLLRDQGYPMVSNVDTIRHKRLIQLFMKARTNCTYGFRQDRLNHPNTIGWSFTGSSGYDNSMAVVISNSAYGTKWLHTTKPNTSYRDLTGALSHTLRTNDSGWANFECPSRGTSVWLEETKYNQLINNI